MNISFQWIPCRLLIQQQQHPWTGKIIAKNFFCRRCENIHSSEAGMFFCFAALPIDTPHLNIIKKHFFTFRTKVLYYLFDEKKITAWLFSLSVALFFNKWVRTTNTYLQLTSFSLVFRDEKWGKKCFHANFISATDVKFSSHDVLLPHRGSTLYLGLGWGNSFRGHTYSL